ncbi:DUF3558 domain-containing protein [Lentzea sp. NPDC005914]|uniref:DUF3558 domain-containing protein n=1 Tax=Lentzea sp. NPDC005914 TaxID=3154572 RepID=UPI00340754F4
MKRSLTLLAALFSLAALAGCSDKSGGNAKPETTSPSDTKSESPSTPAGPQLDLAKFLAKPCDVLTAAQLSPLGSHFKAPAPRTAPLGPACDWKAVDSTVDSSVTVTLADGKEYDSLLSSSRKSPIFSEQKVEGLRSFNSDDTDGTVDCTTAVETGKESAIVVQTSVLDGKTKPCDVNLKVASAVVTTLKG